eukprot:CAMPEP_0198266480 /NCGR_PEP_ID=MMETSP1447-20131203/28573_1 /TAXON_ID=420782 /ORGANISM="Chaetoceros dichaeta, Strain CCMP1751" /LENGTH=250 /DNA_ID=CAMNT_0043956575 /DNA_START=21 /DNA_END=773 /DNA_ORIENTATION=-
MKKTIIPTPQCRLLSRRQYATTLLHITIIAVASTPFSNAYVLPLSSPSFASPNNRNSIQHPTYDTSGHRIIALPARHATLVSPSKFVPQKSRTFPTSIHRLAATNENNADGDTDVDVEEDDDGWDAEATSSNPNPTVEEDQALSSNTAAAAATSSPPSIKESPSSPSALSPEAELEALRTQVANKRNYQSNQSASYSTSNSNTNNSGGEKKRDFFIPIVALVSLAGLFGAYGYEMFKLNLNGELYLPWNQ